MTAMLAKSKARLGNRVKVVEGNVLSMNLPEKFDAIYSQGGPLDISQVGEDYHLYSFLPSFEETINMLNNISHHLINGGLLVLNIQAEETDADGDKEIGHGIVYRQQKYLSFLENQEMYFWEKDYIFIKKDKIVARDCHKFLNLHGQLLKNTMKAAGFKLKEVSADNLYLVCQQII